MLQSMEGLNKKKKTTDLPPLTSSATVTRKKFNNRNEIITEGDLSKRFNGVT